MMGHLIAKQRETLGRILREVHLKDRGKKKE